MKPLPGTRQADWYCISANTGVKLSLCVCDRETDVCASLNFYFHNNSLWYLTQLINVSDSSCCAWMSRGGSFHEYSGLQSDKETWHFIFFSHRLYRHTHTDTQIHRYKHTQSVKSGHFAFFLISVFLVSFFEFSKQFFSCPVPPSSSDTPNNLTSPALGG